MGHLLQNHTPFPKSTLSDPSTGCHFFDNMNSDMFHFDQKVKEVLEQGYILGKVKHIQVFPVVFPSYFLPPNPWPSIKTICFAAAGTCSSRDHSSFTKCCIHFSLLLKVRPPIPSWECSSVVQCFV